MTDEAAVVQKKKRRKGVRIRRRGRRGSRKMYWPNWSEQSESLKGDWAQIMREGMKRGEG